VAIELTSPKNCNSDDPQISWLLTIIAAEGWHMQGFIQKRGTARKLMPAVGFTQQSGL
jgi:hypothetical protein